MGEILKKVSGCEPIFLLELLTNSLPSDNILQKLNPKWPAIRIGLVNLIKSQVRIAFVEV